MDSLHHPSLNATLRGVPSVQTIRIPAVHEKRILQFRGIKFASIPARFSFAELIDDWNGAELDCTAFGPICPQFKDIDISQLVGLPCGDEPKEEQDEFECLRLNVTLPEDAPHNPEKIPVMVWIHGGSFMATIGSGQTKYGGELEF